jgi:hypothetical protein
VNVNVNRDPKYCEPWRLDLEFFAASESNVIVKGKHPNLCRMFSVATQHPSTPRAVYGSLSLSSVVREICAFSMPYILLTVISYVLSDRARFRASGSRDQGLSHVVLFWKFT